MLMPGAPLLEQALSQKQFIVKHNKQGKSKTRGSKSKGANGTTGGLMRAYFPNLITKKDVTMVSPTALAQAHHQYNT